MFTGLIEGPGKVSAMTGREQGHTREVRLEIVPEFSMQFLKHGESIAVNGVCLTVEAFFADRFTMYASPETLGLTNLGQLKAGSRVNLERALALGDRLGGHLVSGHVDCLARVGETRQLGQSRLFRLTFPDEFSRLVVPKGSVALDGISLTVNGCGRGWLEVNIIPATWQSTTISRWRPGDAVNMEADMIGKYVQRMMTPWTEHQSTGGFSEAFLREHGF
ncbi:MAG TPA: riboflavin synthase [Desulfonatronum sp.]|nr:riboflavin synthase [Desulfonatronum sp.]